MNSILHTIHLHGRLKRFGTKFELAVNTPAEAVRALTLQIDGFREAFRDGYFKLVRGRNQKTGLYYSKDALHFPIGSTSQDFHIVPVVSGAKSGGGVGKIVLGAVIVGASVWLSGGLTSGAGLSAALGQTAFGGITYGGIATFGTALMLAGVANVLSPAVQPNYSNNERPDQRASFFLGGQVNQAAPGATIPVVYGRMRVGSTVVSAGLTAERLPV